jgi:hypothetical protein
MILVHREQSGREGRYVGRWKLTDSARGVRMLRPEKAFGPARLGCVMDHQAHWRTTLFQRDQVREKESHLCLVWLSCQVWFVLGLSWEEAIGKLESYLLKISMPCLHLPILANGSSTFVANFEKLHVFFRLPLRWNVLGAVTLGGPEACGSTNCSPYLLLVHELR